MEVMVCVGMLWVQDSLSGPMAGKAREASAREVGRDFDDEEVRW